jgi:hypothetical protein
MIMGSCALRLDEEHKTSLKFLSFRQKLFLEAKSKLEKSGLKTVADLKRALIFSKESLREYLDKHLIKNKNK